jgi:ADP-heptose:LPS heptosyltransferase
MSKKDNRPVHFMVISTTGIGDALMGTPALRALRESFPQSRIHLLLHAKKRDLFRMNPHVDSLWEYRDNPIYRSYLGWKTRFIVYDHVLVFHANDDLWKILRHLRYRDCYTRQKFHDPERKVFSVETLARHSIQKRLALVERVGGRSTANYRYELSVPESQIRWAGERIQIWKGSNRAPLIGFQLGANDRFKCWPVEHFVELARRFRKALGAHIFLNGAREDEDLISEFQRLYGSEGLSFNLEFTLMQSAAILRSCALFVSPDTGPMHMAIGLQVPLVALFAPTAAEETGPLNYDRAAVIQKPPSCEPCLTRRCTDPICMRQISVEEVFAASMRLLGWRSRHSNENCNV